MTFSAPRKSGYTKEVETIAEARSVAARLMDIDEEDIVERESGDGGTIYFYASEQEATDDKDGAYSMQLTM